MIVDSYSLGVEVADNDNFPYDETFSSFVDKNEESFDPFNIFATLNMMEKEKSYPMLILKKPKAN